MKVGVIGLGNIAQKAYLPIVGTRENLELVFATRTDKTRKRLAAKYNVKQTMNTVDELVTTDIEAAFVHAATEAHVKIVRKLLENDIHVYVDKPIAYNYEEAAALGDLAAKKELNFMVGFNRRYVPMYQKLNAVEGNRILKMDKNRTYNPGQVREVIFDDFIHVVDTLRYLAGGEIEDLDIDAVMEEEILKRVMITYRGANYTAVGIMNRDNGITEERVEVMGFKKKLVVEELTEMSKYEDGSKEVIRSEPWNQMLYNRGFVNIIDHFLELLKTNDYNANMINDHLLTHKVCEEIVQKIKCL
ncbi:Gfo/Idh/MocA family protein [Halanaerobacter jeridensis]|uniref:Virulence factor n=1 Tax=Halanaerobacter jeridensis TaxID=706427 RepID=A0A938XSD2_9FIRM|nr:Gfo/Idh/MocA family oxidoreductase [Halanaerobacter jeridensis]MBM7555949.1 virulence factor [Halanaerobacter jeridensis]